MKQLFKSFKGLLVIVLILLLWLAISQTEWADKSPANLWFAKISEVMNAMIEIFMNQVVHITSSLTRVFSAVFIVIVMGTVIGIVIGFFNQLYDSLKLSIDFWRSIPPIIVIPIMYRWDPSGGNEYYWRIGLVLFGCLPIMIMLIADAINNTSKKKLLIFQSINTSVMFKIRHIIIYEILPNIFSGTRTVISFAIIIIIVSEMVLAPEQGVGRQILHYQIAYEIQFVYGYAIIVGIIGIGLNNVVRKIESKLVSWN